MTKKSTPHTQDTKHPSPGSEAKPPAEPSRAVPHGAVALVLVALVVVVYGQVYGFDFVNYDDTLYVTKCERTQQGLSWENVRWAFTTGEASNWHPLTWLSHMLDVALFGVNPGPHHLINVLFHMANTLLLFYVLRALTRGALWPSALVAALFAVHPLHVESVAWIAERKDGLSTLFWLLTMAGYCAYARRPHAARYLLVLVPFVLGLMAKPMLVTLPAVLLLLDYWPLGRLTAHGTDAKALVRAGAKLVAEKAPLFALAIGSAVVTVLAQQAGKSMAALGILSVGFRIGNALVSYVRYILMALWPQGLAVFYPHPGPDLPVWQMAGAALCLLVLTGLVFRFGFRRPYLIVGWLWYVGTLLPVIGLVQVGAQALADRYTYVPLTGLFIIVAWGAGDVAARLRVSRTALSVLAGVMLAVLTVCAVVQTSRWRDNTALYTHALRVTEGNHLAHKNLGVEFAEQGRYEEAVDQYVKSAKIKSNDADLHYNLGNALGELEKWDDAVRMYEKALKIDPGHVPTYFNLGNAYAKREQYEQAIDLYTKALKHHPDHTGAVVNLGNTLAMLGRLPEAIEYFRKAIELTPEEEDPYINLGNALAQMGQTEEAVGYYEKAITLNPDHVDAHNNLAIALTQLGRLDEARAAFAKALRLDPANAQARDSLRRIEAALQDARSSQTREASEGPE